MAGKRRFNFDGQLLEHVVLGRADVAKSMLNEDLAKASDQSMNTLLHYAVLGNSYEIVRHLIGLGADVERPGLDGNTPLMLAVRCVDGSVDDLMNSRVDGVFVNDDRFASLLTARNLRIKILKCLISRLQSQTVDTVCLADKLIAAGCNLVHCAMNLRNDQVIHCMLQRGCDINAKDRHGITALHIASKSQEGVTLAKLLLDHGADVNTMTEIWMSPLSTAAHNGNKEMMKVLLDAGADPNVADIRSKYTAIFVTFINPKNLSTDLTDECLELLFQHGAVPRYPSHLFDIASQQQDSKKINMLVNHLVMLKELGRPIAESDFHCEKEQLHSTIPVLVDACQRFLKSVFFGNLSLFDLLTDSESKMRTRVRNNHLLLKLHQLLSDDENKRIFPYYCSTLAKRISNAVAIVRLEDAAIPSLSKLLNCSYNQGYTFAREIVGYLSVKDLEKLCRT